MNRSVKTSDPLALKLIGVSVAGARDWLSSLNMRLRELKIDGRWQIYTNDYDVLRVDVASVNGRITEVLNR